MLKSTRNRLGLGLIILSLIVLYPGLFEPILSLEIGITLPIVGKTTFYERTQSIVESIEFLWENNNSFVAFLILLFSVTVPLIKACLLLFLLFAKNISYRSRLFGFVRSISKWSMADVFVVGVFIAYLSTKSTEGIEAELHEGFYYFTAYCLISLLSVQFIKIVPDIPAKN